MSLRFVKFGLLAVAAGALPAWAAKEDPAFAVTGAVDAVVANEHGLIASQAGTVVWVSPHGDVVRRPVPTGRLEWTADARRDRQAQAQADEDLFDRHGVEADLRHEVQGEAWLEDMRPTRSASGASGAWGDGPAGAVLLAANATTAFVASEAGLFELLTPGALKPRLKWTQPPQALAVSARGRVAMASALGVSVMGGHAQTAVCAPTMGPIDDLAAFEMGSQGGDLCAQTALLWRQGHAVTVATKTGLFVLPWRASSLASCGDFALVNADEGMFFVAPSGQPAQPVSWQRVASQAPHPHVRCSAAFPWAVAAFDGAGGGASVSVDGGRSWRPLAVPAGMPLADVAIAETGPWLATPWGLGQPGMATPAPTRGHTAPRPPAPAASWARWLPLVDVTAGWGLRTQSRTDGVALASHEPSRDASVWLTAEFPLTARPLRAAFNETVPAPAPLTELPGQADADTNDPAPPPAPRAPGIRPALRPTPSKPHRPSVGPPACLADLREAAVALAMAHPQGLQSLVSRARYAAWLPELRFRAEKRLGRNQSLDFDSDTIFAPLGVRTVNDMRLEVRASWDLSRVVYSPDELAATVQAARIADARREVSVLVNRLFFERRRREAALADDEGSEAEAEANLSDDPPRAPRRLRSTTNLQPLRTAELSADLDALTGGLAATCR